MNLIEVREKNIKTLAKLTDEIWHEYWPCILSEKQIDYMVEKFQSENAIINQMKNENYKYYFINYENKNVGYVGISPHSDYLFLSKLYVKKEFRHKGIGKAVFEKIKDFGFDKIQLTVNKYNKNTIDAYLKYGFKIIDSVVSDIGNGFVMDDYIMEYCK